MRILHIAPHYGGGIAPAVVGIFEAIKATHILIEIEKTQDAASLNLLTSNRLLPKNVSELRNNFEFKPSTDLVIFHFWESLAWTKITKLDFSMKIHCSILLNHQAFSFNGDKVQKISEHFSYIVQSGFSQFQIPYDWEAIPTCRNVVKSNKRKLTITQKAIYLGTLAYKKVDKNFFNLAMQLNKKGITLDIFGEETDFEFSKDLEKYQNENLRYRGYTSNSSKQIKEYTYFFYPLQAGHYGTSENSLLEAMCEGLIPLVRNNLTERTILGRDLMNTLELENCVNLNDRMFFNDTDLLYKISSEVKERAFNLTNLDLRQSKWRSVLEKTKLIQTKRDLNEILSNIISGL